MMSLMTKCFSIAVVAAAALAVLAIFLSPMIDLMPAPALKYTPAVDLFLSILAVACAWAVAQVSVLFGSIRPVLNPFEQGSEAIEFFCTRRC